MGNKVVLEWGTVRKKLQMQLMEGIVQMIAHNLDTLEKKGLHHGDKKEEVSQ